MAQKLGFFIRTINSTVFKIVRRFAKVSLVLTDKVIVSKGCNQ